MGLVKSRKRNDTVMDCRPRTYAENVLNRGVKKDTQNDINV